MYKIKVDGKAIEGREFMNMPQALAFAFQNGQCHSAKTLEIAESGTKGKAAEEAVEAKKAEEARLAEEARKEQERLAAEEKQAEADRIAEQAETVEAVSETEPPDSAAE